MLAFGPPRMVAAAVVLWLATRGRNEAPEALS